MQNNNRAKKSWYKKWWGVLLIIITALILVNLIAFGFYVFSIIKSIDSGNILDELDELKVTGNIELNEEIKEKIEGTDNYWIGSANPKVTIVEFSDFACPYCKNSYPKIREISLKYKDSVKIIYRDLPLHEESLDLSMAARCAGEQGLFWLMHDKLFQNQGVYKKEDLIELANQIGADINKFNTCLSSNKYIKQIQQDFSDGELLEISGTPTWFINGQKLEGDIPLNIFLEIIEKILQE